MIIKTRKLSAREVKKKLHDFIDDISEDCSPEVEQMAEELKAHGDQFVDALVGSGNEASYRNGGVNHFGSSTSYRSHAYMRNGESGGQYSNGGADYRNEGDWKEREELRKQNEREIQELEHKLQYLKMRRGSM